MKTLNLILIVMLLSLGAANLSVLKSEPEQKHISSTESKKEAMSVPEDINGDGVADIDDLVITLLENSQFCSCPGYPSCTSYCTGDLNHDGVTNLNDILQEYNYICSQLH